MTKLLNAQSGMKLKAPVTGTCSVITGGKEMVYITLQFGTLRKK
jgi:hypothetical protein